MIVCGMIVVSVAVLYSIVQGLRRGPKLPAVLLLAAVALFIVVTLVHDFLATESLSKVIIRLLLVFVPLAVGAYAHALRSRSGL